jgi:L-ascorbate metabolism protein UlaG (beta-lactamase superfamily)
VTRGWHLEQLTTTLHGSLKKPLRDGIRLRLHWLGQAGFILRGRSATVLIDPYLSDSLAVKYAGRRFPHKRMAEAPISPEDVPHVDLIVITHDHTDHMDPGTLPHLANQHPAAHFVVPARSAHIAIQRGVPGNRLIAAQAGELIAAPHGVVVHPLASAHEELDINEDGSRFLGYVIDIEAERVYHSGDCVPHPTLRQKLARLHPTIALLPVNGRDAVRLENGVPGNFHLHEAVELCKAAQVPVLIPHHWGMFDFNTVALDAIERFATDTEPPPRWYIPSLDSCVQV